MNDAKYIRTNNDQIIVFSAGMNHSDFKHMNPVSAGFICFQTDIKTRDVICQCYGESVGLKLKSDTDDSKLAEIQLLNNY